MMVEGTKNGEILRGLLRLQERVVLGLDGAKAADAGAGDDAAAIAVDLLEVGSRESTTACMPAAMPYCMNSSMRRASLAEMY